MPTFLKRALLGGFIAMLISAPEKDHAHCEADEWTQVHWYVRPAATYRYQVDPGVAVRWRWFSGGAPPIWTGGFTTTGTIDTPPSWYTSLEFLCSSDSPVTVTPV